jgi:hypothetical protein
MKRKQIYIIIDIDGDIYCASSSSEKANKIMAEDIAKGDLKEGAFITETALFYGDDK